DAEQTFPIAKSVMDGEIDQTVRRDIGGDEQRISRKQTNFNVLTFQHLLLPIWLLTVMFQDKPFQVFINGVTGEVQGQRPWSKVKIAALVAVIVLVLIVAAVIYASVKKKSGT
ncbi:MAG TPA: hypothetical protein VGM93_13540, partial [Acidimicrobiales bacterium]